MALPVAVILPAFNEVERIAATVRAVQTIPGVTVVVVVDDGSADNTAAIAGAAGATVVRHAQNRGKAAAMETGVKMITDPKTLLLFLDADLTETAHEAAKLIIPLQEDATDMTIATFPKTGIKGGGMGFVVRLARWGIQKLTGQIMEAPLSGQRCIRRATFDAALPLASGFGVETALTIDVLRAGYRVLEVPTQMAHRVTGSDWKSRMHRAKQWRDVAKALLPRLLHGNSKGTHA